MAGPYRECPICGSNNDPGEKCACNGIAPKPQKQKRKKRKKTDKPTKGSELVIYTRVKNGLPYTFCTYKDIGITDVKGGL